MRTTMERAVRAAGLTATRVMRRVESAESLDGAVAAIRRAVTRLVPAGPLRDLLHGVPFGHPLHPVLVQIPLGAWVSAVVLDRIPGTARAARVLVGFGTLAAAPAAIAGIVDWAQTRKEHQRVGLVHWAANSLAVGCFAASFVQRVRGHEVSGRRLALLGGAAASVGGYVGGHLAFRQAVGANHVEDVPYSSPDGWQPVGAFADLPDRTLSVRQVGEVAVLLYRDGDDISAIADTCSHLSGPLHEGELQSAADGGVCVVCPWHGSVFSLDDGSVVHGPATSPQPLFSARVLDGQIEVRLAAHRVG